MGNDLSLTFLRSQDELFNQILVDPAFSAIEANPQTGTYGRSYYPAYWGTRYRDLSFAVMWQRRPALVILCGITDDVLGLHGLPMQIFFRQEHIEEDVLEAAIEAAFAQINQTGVAEGAREIRLREVLSPTVSPIGERALDYDASTSVALTGMVDLTAGPV